MTTGQKAIAGLIALGIVLAGTAGVKSHLEADGAVQYAVRDDVAVMKVLRAAGNAISSVYRTDTLRLVQQVATHDTMVQHLIDTAIVEHHDTVSVPVQVLVDDQQTIKACMVVRTECEAGWANARAQVADLSAQLQKVKQLQPSPWLPHPGLGVAAGINPSGKFDVVAGLTFAWKFP